MFRKRSHRTRSRTPFSTAIRFSAIRFISLIAFAAALATTAQAQSASIRGKILDPLGNPVAQAKVTLIQEGREDKTLADSTSSPDGAYQLQTSSGGRYAVHVEATGFDSQTSDF